MRLLVDIGNSQVKIVPVTAGQFGERLLYPLSAFDKQAITQLFQQFPTVTKLTVASVVPASTALLMQVANKRKVPCTLITATNQSVVKVNTKNPAEVGADLVACAAAVTGRTIIVDFGTATTISLVDRRSIEGVSIAPGLATQLASIVDEAALLESITLRATDQFLGRDTTEALLAGIVMGQATMVEGVIQSLGKASVVFTGGFAPMINQTLGNKYTVDPSLLMKGLQLIDGD
jgi:type III pantothenate kinase